MCIPLARVLMSACISVTLTVAVRVRVILTAKLSGGSFGARLIGVMIGSPITNHSLHPLVART